MARHNYASVIAMVRRDPEVHYSPSGDVVVCPVTTIIGDRDQFKAKTGYQLHSSTFNIIAEDKKMAEKVVELEELDIIRVSGFIATRVTDKHAPCPECGAENYRREACDPYGKTRSGGNTVYLYPMYLERKFHCIDENEGFQYLHENEEDVNKVFLTGNLTREPVQGTLDAGQKIYTRFQIAINRKYCPRGVNSVYERTDYPWIYSYGEKSIEDYERLKTGSLVQIDGAIQTRKYKEQYTCQTCGSVYDVPGRTLEILSYGTEYLSNFNGEGKPEIHKKEDRES